MATLSPGEGSLAPVSDADVDNIGAGWSVTRVPPGSVVCPERLVADGSVVWYELTAGRSVATATDVLHASRILDGDPDEWDYWFHCQVVAGGGRWLQLEGIASLSDVWVGRVHVLSSDSMFAAHVVDLAQVPGWDASSGIEIWIRCRSLNHEPVPRLPRARWRTRLVKGRSLRWHRTSLFGRVSSLGGHRPLVGPWRPVRLIPEPRRMPFQATVQSRMEGGEGIVEVALTYDRGVAVHSAQLHVGQWTFPMSVDVREDGTTCVGHARIPEVESWWPHTHGRPHRYDAYILACEDGEKRRIPLRPVGFRTVQFDPASTDGRMRVNGRPVFVRGACWIPLPSASTDDLRQILRDVRDAGMNMLRVSGVTFYEDSPFYDLCDELGLMVWQDLMFANMDYPLDDDAFRARAAAEVSHELRRLGHRASLVVLCGSSEVQQQAAMLGLPPETWRSTWYEEQLPELCRRARPDVPYVPSSPFGGVLPFHTDAGVAHYFGVGAYRRHLEDAIVAEPNFASECLAFAIPPAPEAIVRAFGTECAMHLAAFQSEVPRDAGADWDFLDVSDHYLRTTFQEEPETLRREDETRYLHALSCAVGEVMAAVQACWRRPHARCGGALIWHLRDTGVGPGWGLFSGDGLPKAPYYHLKRSWQPLSLLIRDAGLNGLRVIITNEHPEAFAGTLEVECVRYDGVCTARGAVPVQCPGGETLEVALEIILGAFIDSSYAYRFGPPSFDCVIATLADRTGSSCFRLIHHPLSRTPTKIPEPEIQLRCELDSNPGIWRLTLESQGFAHSVAIIAEGFRPSDNFFHLAPGRPTAVYLRQIEDGRAPQGQVRALNAVSAVPFSASCP